MPCRDTFNLGRKRWFSKLKVSRLDIEIKRSRLSISPQKLLFPDIIKISFFVGNPVS